MSNGSCGADDARYERWQAPEVDIPDGAQVGALMTASRIEKLEQAAREEGYEVGYSEGLKAGEREIAERVNRLDSLAHTLARPLDGVDEAVERELLAIATALARQLVRRELQLQPDEIIPVIREAVAMLPHTAHKIEICLHPEDSELARSVLNVDPDGADWVLRPDPELIRGDCRVVSDLSEVDARLETRLTALFSNFLSGQRGSEDDGE